MNNKKEFSHHEEPSETINLKFTDEAVADLANRFHDSWAEQSKNQTEETKLLNLAAEVCMNQALILQLQEDALSVPKSKEELQTTTVRELCRKVAELEAKVNAQQMANSVRLEKLEGRR